MLLYDSNKATREGKEIKAASTQYALLPSRKSDLFCGKEDTMRRERAESIPRTFGRQTIITETSVPRLALQENTDAISSVQLASIRRKSRAFISPGNGKTTLSRGRCLGACAPSAIPSRAPFFPRAFCAPFILLSS